MSLGNLNRHNPFSPVSAGQQQRAPGFQSSPFSHGPETFTAKPQNPFRGVQIDTNQGLDQLSAFKQQVAPNVNLEAPMPKEGTGRRFLAMG